MNMRIQMLRASLHLSQREFGEKLGVSRDVISNLEYGRTEPKDVFIKHICSLYHVNENWLRTGKPPMFLSLPQDNSRREEAMRIFQSLTPEFQDCALAQIRQLSKLQSSLCSSPEENVSKPLNSPDT